MPVEYRDATVDDAAPLAAVFGSCFTDTFGHLYDPADLSAFLASHAAAHWAEQLGGSDYAVRVAEAAGEIAGFAKLGPLKLPVETTVPAIELRQLYVLKPWHGTGVAAALMDWVIDESRKRGMQELYLSVFTENFRAQRFYARYGLEVVGPCLFMVGNQADEDVIMRRLL